MDISALTVDRGTPRTTFLSAQRASAAVARPAEGDDGGGKATSPQEVAIAALRKELDAAQAALRQAQEGQAGPDAVEAARQRVAIAGQALADAQLRQAQQSGGSGGSIDTYA